MEKLLRKTGINQSLRLLLIIASLVFGSSAWGQTTTTIFSETFDNFAGTGGNDNLWSGSAAGTDAKTTSADNQGWSFIKGYAADQCVKFGTKNGLGSATTPTLNFTGDATLTFRAGAWSGDAKTLNISISNGTLSQATVTLADGAFTVYSISITKVTENPTITFAGKQNSKARFFLDDVVVTQTTTSGGGGKTAATVTFEKENYSVQTNGEITVSATKNSTSPIVYSISPEDDNVLINENTGYIVTVNKAGTYTITATVAENESYTSASATCVLTVTAPAPPAYNITAPTYYKKITSTDELAAGATYLIVCEEENCAIGSISSSKGQPTPITYTANNEKGINIISDIAQAAEYLLERNPDGSLSLKNGTSYLKASSGSNTDLANNTTANTNNEKWTFAFNDGNVELVSKVSTSRHLIYRAGTSNVFGNYGKSSTGAEYKKVQLYQKVTDLAISTLTNGYATFVTDVPYVMPKGACGYAVTVAPQAGVITKTEAYAEGKQVPAQTALLIGGAPGTNYYPAVLKDDVAASYSGENYMEGRRTAEGYTNSQKGGAVYYYKLALNSKSKPGFYYGAADGAAFQLTKPTTAYLAVPQSITPVNGYLIDFDGEETGISTIAPTNGNADGAIYNLNGIRMTQTLRNLPKGVYIVNGKKVIK